MRTTTIAGWNRLAAEAVCLLMLCCASAAHAQTVYVWDGDTSNSTPDPNNWVSGVAPTGSNAQSEDWQFPGGLAGGASVNPTVDSGGQWTVGGTSGGGITFTADAPEYTFSNTDPANVINLAGASITSTDATRGFLTNNSPNTQTFACDFQTTRATIDAKSGDVVFTAGHQLLTGGTVSIASGNTTRTNNAASLSTIIQGDHTIFLNATVVQSTNGGNTGNGNRGRILYRGAGTTPTAATALVLGDIGPFTGRIVVDSANGGVVRATSGNSFGDGTYSSGGPRDTFIGNPSGGTGATSNGAVELDGTPGDLTIPENFRVETRPATGTPHLRNVAGNNTISGYIASIFDGDVAGGADSLIIESAGGKLTLTGTIDADLATTMNVYLQGSSDGEIGGALGIFEEVAGSQFTVTKRGGGTWTTLAGTNNTYLGATTIEAGKYVMNGTHTTVAAGAYTVNSGATLGGSGTIGSAVVVNAGGTLAPGASVGTLATGSVALDGALAVEVSGANIDLLNVTGDLALGAASTLHLVSGTLSAVNYTIATTTGAVTGVFGTATDATSHGYSVVYTANQITLEELAGDANHDGTVDIFDVNFVSSHWAGSGPNGDVNHDNAVDIFDVNLISSNWNHVATNGGGGATAVPEPSGFALLTIGMLAGAVCARRASRHVPD